MLYPCAEWELEEIEREVEKQETRARKVKIMKLGLVCPGCGGKDVIRERGDAICRGCGMTWELGGRQTVAQQTLRGGYKPLDVEMCCGTPLYKGRCRVCGTKVD